jgi:carboxyl-terminal processing protease
MVLISGLFVLLVCVIAPAIPTNSQAEVFEQVWQTVRDNFYDSKFNGVDWSAMRQKYRSQATKAPSIAAFSDVINQMLVELKTSHTRFYTQTEPAYYQLAGIFRSSIQSKLKPFLPNGKLEYTGIGIFTKDINNQTFINAILNGSPAEKAGLKVGDRILSVDNQPFQAIQSFVDKAGKPVQVQIQRTSGNAQTIAVTPQKLDPNRMFLDAMKNSVEIIQRNGKQIGYIHIWSYADQQYQDQLEEALSDRLSNIDGFVWDLRDGWGGASPSYLGLFTSSVPSLTLIERDGDRRQIEGQWKKPIVMLVNQGSRSGKEILAQGFRKYRVGTIVGSKTAGAVVAGRAFVMKDGSLLYLAVADVLVDGDRLEGKGVTPDVEVPFTLEYSQGVDVQKERAIEVVLQQVGK